MIAMHWPWQHTRHLPQQRRGEHDRRITDAETQIGEIETRAGDVSKNLSDRARRNNWTETIQRIIQKGD